jgi:hypothetical protein
MGRRKLTKKRRITSITISEDIYEILISQQENISRYIESLIITELSVNKQLDKK